MSGTLTANLWNVDIIGTPHAKLREEVEAFVVAKNTFDDEAGTTDLTARLIAHCRAALRPIKSPRSAEFVTFLSRSEAGKIVKAELMKRYWSANKRLVT